MWKECKSHERLKKQQHILKVPMTLKEKYHDQTISSTNKWETLPPESSTQHTKNLKNPTPPKNPSIIQNTSTPPFLPLQKKLMWVFYGPRAPEAKPASMASASKCESNIFRRPLVLAPAAVPAGSSFEQSWGCLHGTRWWVEFLSGHRDTSGAKNASCQVGFLGWFYFCLR